MITLLEKKLEHPKFCPHGNPIPTEKGEEEEECYPLTEVGLNENCKVARITDGKRENLLTLAAKGIKPNVPLHVVERKPLHMVLCVAGKECTLSYDDASNVWVKIVRRNKRAVQE